MEKVCSHIPMEISTRDGGDSARKMEQAHTHSLQTEWNYTDFGRMANRKCLNGYSPMEPTIKEHLLIISLMGRVHGILRMEIKLVECFSRRK